MPRGPTKIQAQELFRLRNSVSSLISSLPKEHLPRELGAWLLGAERLIWAHTHSELVEFCSYAGRSASVSLCYSRYPGDRLQLEARLSFTLAAIADSAPAAPKYFELFSVPALSGLLGTALGELDERSLDTCEPEQLRHAIESTAQLLWQELRFCESLASGLFPELTWTSPQVFTLEEFCALPSAVEMQ